MEKMDSDRLKRWKCLFCGCKDKNVIDAYSEDNSEIPTVKIVTCENCGHTDMFAVSALAAYQFLTGDSVNREDSKKFKRCFHMYNHNMPSATEPHMENSNKIPR